MADIENDRHLNHNSSRESTALLRSDLHHLRSIPSNDFISCHIRKIHSDDSWVWRLRRRLQEFLTSKWGHYFVLILVSLDIACIFADFLISLHICEHNGEKAFKRGDWIMVNDVLGFVSLTFSCLFMAELLGSVFAFGFSYFNSKFHIFDATVIVAAFIVDVLLRGVLEEAGSLVVALRLWRVFKIIEEFSSGAEDELAELQERITDLEHAKSEIVKENQALRLRLRSGTNVDSGGTSSEEPDGHAG